MFKFAVRGMIVILIGLLWATESLLGKMIITHGHSPFYFPWVLNVSAVAIGLTLSLNSKFRKKIFSFHKNSLLPILMSAMTLVFIPYCALYFSLQKLSPAETSLITGLTPIFSLIINTVLFKAKLEKTAAFSITLGFGGIFFLIIPDLSLRNGPTHTLWYLITLIVPISYSTCGYFLRNAYDRGVCYYQLLFSTNAVSAACFTILNKGFELNPEITSNHFWILPLGILINLAAISLMFYLSKNTSPFVLSISNYSTILFSSFLSMAFFDLKLSFLFLISMTFICASAFLATSRNIK